MSDRVKSIKSSAIRKMLELSQGMADVIHLEHGEPDFATPSHIVEAAILAMKEGFTHYTDINGMLELREAIAEKLKKENKIDANPKTEITVVSGVQEAILITALGLLNPGDEALVLAPYYPAYFESCLLAGATPISVPLNEEMGYSIDSKVLESKISDKTKMIWMCNPSNPTGHVYRKEDLEIIAEVAQKHNLIVFVDEVYEKLVYEDAKHISIASLPGMFERTITANGFSKSYAMTGWRIGYIVAEEEISNAIRKLHYYAVLCPSAISQKAALAALTGPQECIREMVDEYNKRRKLVVEMLSKIEGILFVEPKGAFYAFPNFSYYEGSDEELALRLLKNAKVVLVPGSGFGETGIGHLRISYSAAYEKVKEGIKRIIEFLRGYKGKRRL